MAKVVSLSKEAYERLKAIKKDRSFSETLLALLDRSDTPSLWDVARGWKADPELADAIERA